MLQSTPMLSFVATSVPTFAPVAAPVIGSRAAVRSEAPQMLEEASSRCVSPTPLMLPGPGSEKTQAGKGEPLAMSLWPMLALASGNTRGLFPHARIGSCVGITASSCCLGLFLKALAWDAGTTSADQSLLPSLC